VLEGVGKEEVFMRHLGMTARKTGVIYFNQLFFESLHKLIYWMANSAVFLQFALCHPNYQSQICQLTFYIVRKLFSLIRLEFSSDQLNRKHFLSHSNLNSLEKILKIYFQQSPHKFRNNTAFQKVISSNNKLFRGFIIFTKKWIIIRTIYMSAFEHTFAKFKHY